MQLLNGPQVLSIDFLTQLLLPPDALLAAVFVVVIVPL